jgi:hypothetical protein
MAGLAMRAGHDQQYLSGGRGFERHYVVACLVIEQRSPWAQTGPVPSLGKP